MDKQTQRTSALQKRNALDLHIRTQYNNQIVQKLLPFLKQTNAIYLPYGSEVDITPILQTNHTFAIPKTLKQNEMIFIQYEQNLILQTSKYGILEPLQGTIMKDFDVMIIPLVAFDNQCHRLGHGKGFYDRYLTQFKGLKIGVAYECQKVEQVCIEAHDIALDYIVTESTIYQNF